MRKLRLIGTELFDKKYLLFYSFYSMISMVMNLNGIWIAGLHFIYELERNKDVEMGFRMRMMSGIFFLFNQNSWNSWRV